MHSATNKSAKGTMDTPWHHGNRPLDPTHTRCAYPPSCQESLQSAGPRSTPSRSESPPTRQLLFSLPPHAPQLIHYLDTPQSSSAPGSAAPSRPDTTLRRDTDTPACFAPASQTLPGTSS